MKATMKGLDKVLNKLRDIERRAQALDGHHDVKVSELLNPSFLAKCSQFKSADEFFSAGGFSFNSKEEFEAIPESALDAHAKATTTYATWKEMLNAAAGAWAKKQMGF